MSIIESLNETSNKAVSTGEVLYSKTQEYYKLKVFHQVAITTSTLLKSAIIGSLAFFGFVLLTVGGVIHLAEVLNSSIQACLFVGAGVLAVSFLVYITRKFITNLVVRKLSVKFFESHEV